jgi:hypothetical protein
MRTQIRVESSFDYIDGYFSCATTGKWQGAIWRAQVTYARHDGEMFYKGEPTWEYAEPDEGFEEAGCAPPEVLALYEKHKDELFVLLLAERLKG